jgi:hypothetical protein
MLGHLRNEVKGEMLRALGAYGLAVVVTYVCAAIAATQSVMSRLGDMGVDVDFALRLQTTLQDLSGMVLYLMLIAVALAIAFPVAALVSRFLPRWRSLGYPLAGGVAILALHFILNQALNITPVPAARTTLGLAVQALAGVLGGYVCLRVLPRKDSTATS